MYFPAEKFSTVFLRGTEGTKRFDQHQHTDLFSMAVCVSACAIDADVNTSLFFLIYRNI